jgi:site-specific DNA-methyltransferase (adenine-specific)
MKLYNGDCLEVMKQLPDNYIDFILTDLPYGTTACKWDNIIPYDPMWEQLKRIRKDNTAIALFGTEPFSSHLRLSNLKEYKYDWIWDKKKAGNPLLSKIQPLRIAEFIHIFYKHNYYPIMEKRDKPKKRGKNKGKISEINNNAFIENKIYYYKYPKNIIQVSNANQKNKVHPTQKPVELLEYLIKTYTKENETVLDFTMGSGSTGVACVNTNRKFIGIELDKEYFKIAKERIDEKLYNNTS